MRKIWWVVWVVCVGGGEQCSFGNGGVVAIIFIYNIASLSIAIVLIKKGKTDKYEIVSPLMFIHDVGV